MKKQPFKPTNDGKETDRFIAFAKRVISVPKSEIDAQIEKERLAKEKVSKIAPRKQRS
jgi:hypothetical protein